MNREKNFWKGSVKVRIEGRGMERFFNIAAQRGLQVCDVETEMYGTDKKILFFTTPGDFKRMKPVAKKTGVRLRIVEKHGVPFWIMSGRKRILWVAGAVSFFLLLYVSSLYVWDISFDGNYRFTDQTLLHFMEEIPVRCGMRKSRISCEELEHAIRNRFSDIGWVSAELTGTRLTVHIRENTRNPRTELKETSPCSLTAKKDGIIVRTVVRSGISMVRAGDEVTEGELLVSGELPVYDDSETLVRTHKIHADAEVFAKTTESVAWRLAGEREVRAETGRTRRGLFLKLPIGTWQFLMPDLEKKASWEIFMEEYQLALTKHFDLPVFAGVLTAREYVPYEKARTREEVSETAERYLNEYIENLTEKGIQILGSDVKIERSGSDWTIHGTLTVVEDIAKESPMPENQEEIQTVDEHH